MYIDWIGPTTTYTLEGTELAMTLQKSECWECSDSVKLGYSSCGEKRQISY